MEKHGVLRDEVSPPADGTKTASSGGCGTDLSSLAAEAVAGEILDPKRDYDAALAQMIESARLPTSVFAGQPGNTAK